MNVIRQANEDIIKFLGGFQQKKKYCNYRFNKYCIFVEQNKRFTIIYNSLTGAIVQIKKVELENIFTDKPYVQQEHLIQNYYLVKEDFDEDALIKSYRQQNKKFTGGNYLESPKSFVIMTTSKCNARCPYCYELPLKNKEHMSDETVEKVSNYIIDNASQYSDLELMFFGGEPLYNKEVISKLITRIIGSGFKINTNMISNGYLFDAQTIDEAINDWNLRNCQITIDGTKEVYNKTKNYIYKDDNAFEKIINNIHQLTKKGIDINIRINVNPKNIDDSINLVQYLIQEFSGNTKVHMYAWEVFQYNTEKYSKELFEGLIKINDIIYQNGFETPEECEYGIKTVHCMVDSGDAVLINEKGDIGLCEHYTDSLMVSNIQTPEIKNQEVIQSWFDYVSTEEGLCKNCPLRAICLKMHKCTDERICDEYMQKYYIDKLNKIILHTVAKFEDNQISQCNCCNKN